ncbi:PucR family transcriptional regulator [Cytobacillus kochii]|uniref:PucR family transcriptional regulator n=1 Tax=Cytobacillus kochii TaxID=859143 RepID=UPI00203DF63F|nr:helix-turn-helix domain-containing protein [Cytobacillus kochii]MCM3324147.1 helix-turn-helix domain-containing protein [Cytobacillus kochii]MCM3346450.1 helix-turn-helix domain-containing protein [Cytobacillus kochii]
MDLQLDRIESSTNIEEIAEMISIQLKKPVVIEDAQFSLIAYSSYFTEDYDEVNKQTIFNKQWPISIFERFTDEGIVDQLTRHKKPFRIKAMKDISLNKRVVVSAIYQNDIYGYIWIQETAPKLKEKELAFLDAASSHIAFLLNRDKLAKDGKVEEDHYFYEKVIEDSFQTKHQLKVEAASAKVTLPKAFIVAVFKVEEGDDKNFEEIINTVRLSVNNMTQSAYIFFYHLEMIVLLASHDQQDVSLEENAEHLVQSIRLQYADTSLVVGIGNKYSSIYKLRQSYTEALEVLQTAMFFNKEQSLPINYRKLKTLRYLAIIEQHNKQTNYSNEDLVILLTKDQNNHTNYIDTLEAYLLNNCRLKPTAEELFIHENTLKYRLKKIHQLTTINFDDFNTRCQLFIDLQLLRRKQSIIANHQNSGFNNHNPL